VLDDEIHLEESKLLLDALLENPEGFEEYHASEIAKILKEIYRKEAYELTEEQIYDAPSAPSLYTV